MTSDKSSEERFEAWWSSEPRLESLKLGHRRAKEAWQAQEAYWSEKCEELEKKLETANIVVDAARKWIDENKPSCEESFYQCDAVNEELPMLGINIFNALKVYDENACPNCHGKGCYLGADKEFPHNHWITCHCMKSTN